MKNMLTELIKNKRDKNRATEMKVEESITEPEPSVKTQKVEVKSPEEPAVKRTISPKTISLQTKMLPFSTKLPDKIETAPATSTNQSSKQAYADV
jgi:hypothetical protein